MSESPLISRRHLDFVLYELLKIDGLCAYERYAEHSRETFDQAIDLAHQIAVDHFLSHNRKGDQHEPHLVDGHVEVIPEVRTALDAYVAAGFMAETADEADGGMQLPYVVSLACDGMFLGANVATSGFTLLTRGASNLLRTHGSPEQQRRYMAPMVEGRWFGTMCLSEPQAGSSLADVKCLATPQGDGTYKLNGAKMWISGGDHEVAENIVHLVLARLPDAPPGVRGISLFIVPRYRVNADGTRGARNDVRLAGLNHKLGQRGLPNCFLKFGESDDCTGELVGEANQGLAYMFHMMNEARIGVGLGAIQLGWTAYLYSLKYAQERVQGRHPDTKGGDAKPVPIIEHADVRRMLLLQKAFVEGTHALALDAGLLVDVAAQHDDEHVREEAHLLVEFLTPIVKAWSAELSLRANDAAIQILGGYGYTREYPVEQCWRDNRLNPIHEGANGIQALDLLGRKSAMQNGAALKLFLAQLAQAAAGAAQHAELAPWVDALKQQALRIGEVAGVLASRMAKGDTRATLANAHHYLHLVGHTAIAWMWLRQAEVAAEQLAEGAGGDDAAFYRGKLQACAYFFKVELPTTAVAAQLLLDADATASDMKAEWF